MPNMASPYGGVFQPGTLIHGTLQTRPLLQALADEYERLKPFGCRHLIRQAREVIQHFDQEVAGDVLDELVSELDYVAQLHDHHFGSHPGDGSDIGFWECGDGLGPGTVDPSED
jgi:hypothetical protein